MNWTQPHADRSNYWQSDKYDFWITSKQIWDAENQLSYTRWYLFNGTDELGCYDFLEEAKNAADPAHGTWEDKEATPVCYWCQGTHPGQICTNAPYYVEGSNSEFKSMHPEDKSMPIYPDDDDSGKL